MALISDNYHSKKLKKYGLNIKTKYIVGNEVLERNTDNTKNDDIDNGIRCKKEYYLNNKLVHEETLFDSRIEYTFISKDMENNPPIPAEKFTIVQGHLEASNANVIREMLNTINTSRNYESLSKIVKTNNQLLSAALSVGRIKV